MKTNIDTIREGLKTQRAFICTWADCLSGVQMSEDDFNSSCGAEEHRRALAALSTIDPDELERVKKERDEYKLWWQGATETHNQIRKLYDEQNALMWKILKRPECPEGLAQRLLKMPEADRDYFLSLAVEDIDPDAIRCSDASDLLFDIRNELTLDEAIIAMQKHDDAIRRECDTSVQDTLTICGVHKDAGIRSMLSKAILGTEPAHEDTK